MIAGTMTRVVLVAATLIGAAAPAHAQVKPRTRVLLPQAYRDVIQAQPARATYAVKADSTKSSAVSGSQLMLESSEVYRILQRGDAVRQVTTRFLADRDTAWRTAYAIPEDYLARVGDGTQLAAARPVFLPRGPMRYDRASDRFTGTLMLVLEDLAERQSRTLDDSISIEIVSAADSVSPSPLNIGHTNFPPSLVSVSDDNPRDSVEVTFVTAANLSGFKTHLPVEPALVIETRPRAIQGWGVQSIPLTLLVRGGSFADSVAVRLEASPGSVTPEEVFVHAGRPATARLRSEGSGTATVRAITADVGSDEQTFEYVFPLAFLLSSVIGGLLGAIVAFSRAKAKSQKPQLPIHLVGGVLWGLIVAAAYGVLGLNLLGMTVPAVPYFNEGVVFVVSALGAIGWIPGKKPAPASAG